MQTLVAILKVLIDMNYNPRANGAKCRSGRKPGRGLLIPLGRKRSQKSINNRGRMSVMGGHLTDLKNTVNNRSAKFLTRVELWK